MNNPFVIPAIDLIDGKCVRLSQGDYNNQVTYATDPVEMAKQFEYAGFKRLHLVDLDGARHRQLQHLHILEMITAQTELEVDYGGGVGRKEDVQAILDAGALMVTIGSLAIKNPTTLQEWVDEFGADKFFIGADVKNNTVRIHGWNDDAGIDVRSFIDDMKAMGLNRFFCTDISKDGMLQGPSISLYKSILQRFPGLELVASGGVSSNQDLVDLQQIGCSGAIVGKALYEEKLNLKM